MYEAFVLESWIGSGKFATERSSHLRRRRGPLPTPIPPPTRLAPHCWAKQGRQSPTPLHISSLWTSSESSEGGMEAPLGQATQSTSQGMSLGSALWSLREDLASGAVESREMADGGPKKREDRISRSIMRLLGKEAQRDPSPDWQAATERSTIASDSKGEFPVNASVSVSMPSTAFASAAVKAVQLSDESEGTPKSPGTRFKEKVLGRLQSAGSRSPAGSPTASKPKSAADSRSRAESTRRRKRLAVNELLQKKIRAFDRRWVQTEQLRQEASKERLVLGASKLQSLIQIAKDRPHKADRRDSMKSTTTMGDRASTADRDTQSAYEVAFQIIRYSSQSSDHPASNLCEQQRGIKWESGAGHVRNEWLTLEMEAPATINAVEFGIGEVSCTPRRCRVQYCMKNSNGPWHDAWRFTVESPSGRASFRSDHKYGQHVRQFANAVLKYCGEYEVAVHMLDVNNTTLVSLEELQGICRRLQYVRGTHAAAIAAVDLNALFRELDPEYSGKVRVGDLLREEVTPPSAQWWRLLITDNWGSQGCISLAAPLKLFSPDKQVRSRKNGAMELFGVQVTSPLTKEAPVEVSLHPEAAKLRQLATQHGMYMHDVEEMYEHFQKVDVDASGELSRAEFEQLLVRLLALSELTELPRGRRDFLWKQADRDGNGLVDFPEFLAWVQMMSVQPPLVGSRPDLPFSNIQEALKKSCRRPFPTPPPPAAGERMMAQTLRGEISVAMLRGEDMAAGPGPHGYLTFMALHAAHEQGEGPAFQEGGAVPHGPRASRSNSPVSPFPNLAGRRRSTVNRARTWAPGKV